MERCNLRFLFSDFLIFCVLFIFWYLYLSEHTAKSLIPKSIPMLSPDGMTAGSLYSAPAVTHQFNPSNLIRGL